MAALLQPRPTALLVALASLALLLGALSLQYLGGLPPCPLCVWQRWPHLAVVALGVAGWWWRPRAMLALAGLALLGGAGLAGYHVGIEQGLWALPAGCAAAQDAGSVEELRRMLAGAPPACDQVSFRLFGLSLAAWNGIISVALAALALATALRPGHGRIRGGGVPAPQTALRRQ